jgi:6,7-dimethyl-8-ribityllumazine synthase
MKKANVKLAIAVSEFNYDITYLMLQKALSHAEFLGATVTYVVKAHGSFDLPLLIDELLKKDEVDAVVTLGAVIKGETQHDEVIAHQTSRKILDLSIEHNKPVTLGIIGPRATRAQALARVEEYARRAVEAAIKQVKRLAKAKMASYKGNSPVIIE